MFDWDDFLALGERLAASDDEASRRTAISRAYYAAYHAAAAFARAAGMLPGGHTHQRVWDAFARDPDADRATVGAAGDGLRQRRQAADYRNPFPGEIGRDAEAAIGEARGVIDLLKRIG